MVEVDDSKWSYLLGRLKEQSHKQRESFVIKFYCYDPFYQTVIQIFGQYFNNLLVKLIINVS